MTFEKKKKKKEKKKYESKVKLVTENYKASEEIYSNLKQILNKNIEEIDTKAYNRALKNLVAERE